MEDKVPSPSNRARAAQLNRSMLRITSLALGCLLVAGVGAVRADQKSLSATLHNNSKADLCVERAPRECTQILPGESARVVLRSEQWITFGIVDLLYLLPLDVSNALQKGELLIQVEGDGRMFLLPSGATPPVKTLPQQPRGFPLAPTRRVDLT